MRQNHEKEKEVANQFVRHVFNEKNALAMDNVQFIDCLINIIGVSIKVNIDEETLRDFVRMMHQRFYQLSRLNDGRGNEHMQDMQEGV
jgi:hypothetical protein